ncbi:MAG: ATP-binding protein [Clostridia bacterium]|nr:ATP-binding protein [Clostridia bacterium]
MKRTLTEALLSWKNNSEKKPLIIKGVRQCGKTYLLKEFGKEYYDDVAYFNFEENEALGKVFENDFDVKRILFDLGLYLGRTIKPHTTLIIFDEIQVCSRAITSLKYFCENAPEYHIACAGSLIGIALNKPTSFPVGKVDFLNLYPMSFSEFVRANGEEVLADYIEGYNGDTIVSELVGSKLSMLLKQYYATGGMPEVVLTWVNTHDIEKVEIVQQRIIDSYELDFAKHAPIKDFPKLTAIWHSIPEQLARDNNKFIFGHVKKGWRAKDLEDALEWLIDAGLAYKVCRIEKPFMPMSSYAEPTVFKLYMADVGILRKLSKLPYEVILESSPTYVEFKGAMTENYVLCELIKSADKEPYYWNSGNSAEVDFVIQCGKEIVPIEVKSEKNVKARSLAEYRKKYQPAVSVKTSMRIETTGKEVLNIPLYLISSIKQTISNKSK